MRGPAFDAVLPTFVRAVDDRGGLAVVECAGVALGGHDLLEVVAVRDLHDVPVVQIEKLTRFPLDVVAGHVALAADVVAVDRGLVEVEVYHDVAERCRAGSRQSLAHASRREPAFTFEMWMRGQFSPKRSRAAMARPIELARPTPEAPVARRTKGVAGVG